MAHVSNYTFNTMSRLGADACSIDQTSIQNTEACNYLLQNYSARDCNMTSAKKLATSQPGINYSGSHGMGINGCNVDDNSNLTIGTIQTHPRSRIDLFHRPYATVPYLGRGSVDPILESQIQQGETITNKRSITHLTEKSYAKYSNTPLIPSVKKNVQNSDRMIESDASDGWIRGGLPSRELTRDSDFNRSNGR